MKNLFATIIIIVQSASIQSQTFFRLSDIIPENYLLLITEKLTKTDNLNINRFLSGSPFFTNNSESISEMGNGLVNDYTFQIWSGGSWLNDSSEVYLYNPNNLLFEKKIRKWLGNGWRDSYRYNDYYDSALRLSLVIEQDNSTGSWVDSLKRVYGYNNQGQLYTVTSSHWYNSQWENLRLTTSTYNNNLHIHDINQNWDGSSWENSGRTTYIYNSNGYPTNSVLSIWLFGTWINLLQIVLSYNSDGLLDEFKIQWWNFISGWANLTRILFTYDNNYYLIGGLAQDWNGNTSSWINYSRITSDYNQNNLLHTDFKELWNTNNNWVNESLITYSYDANLNREEVLMQNWNGGNWINSIRELYNYIVTSVEEINQTPEDYFLSHNYPNPFNPSTTIKISIPTTGYATLKIFNALGEQVAVLLDKKLITGTYEVEWNASDYPSGIYFYQLKTNGFVETKKMILIK